MPKVPHNEVITDQPRETPSDPETLKSLQTSAKAAKFMSTYATIMDTYGADVLGGLVPGLGDGSIALGSLLIELQKANTVGLPWHDQLGILISQGLDFGIGSIPVVGDIADFFYKSNVKAKDRFVAHFRRELLKAWTERRINESDMLELETLSGIQINLPTPARKKMTGARTDARESTAA